MTAPVAALPVDLEQALVACGDEAVRREATEIVLGDLPAERAALRASSIGGDVPAMARIAHRLKSSLAAVGAVPASAAAADLEREARSGGSGALHLASRLDAELERVAPALAESLRPASRPTRSAAPAIRRSPIHDGG